MRKITLKAYDFVDISNATIPTALGGSTTTSPTTVHPIKAKFSSSKSQLSFTFAAPDTRGLRHEKSSCISFTLIFFLQKP
jgi:hypothetical protein